MFYCIFLTVPLLKQDVFHTAERTPSRPAALLFLSDCIALTSSSSVKSSVSIGSVINTFSIGWSSMTGGLPSKCSFLSLILSSRLSALICPFFVFFLPEISLTVSQKPVVLYGLVGLFQFPVSFL